MVLLLPLLTTEPLGSLLEKVHQRVQGIQEKEHEDMPQSWVILQDSLLIVL